MSGHRPLITLQVGNYANYVGSHFWNQQEASFVYSDNKQTDSDLLEIDHDVLYREGQTDRREMTYTPRLVSVDLKGSLGLLPETGELYGRPMLAMDVDLDRYWQGASSVCKEEPYRKNEFLRELDTNEPRDDKKDTDEKDIDHAMDEDKENTELYDFNDQVNFWSDYLSARFHPRSMLVVDSHQHNNPVHPFDMWGAGRQVWSDCRGFGEEMEDRMRGWAEECDMLGGVQVVADFQDGWGGFTSQLMEMLSDEYPGTPILMYPTSPSYHTSYTLESGLGRLAAAALSLSTTTTTPNTLVTPLTMSSDWYPLAGRQISLPHLTYDPNLHYHSSAPLSLALDNSTLSCRLRSNISSTPMDIVRSLATHGCTLASLSTDIPIDMTGMDYFESGHLMEKLTPLLPCPDSSSSIPHSSIVTIRGLQAKTIYSRRSPAYNDCSSPDNYISTCLNRAQPHLSPSTILMTRPANTSKPFPHIFSDHVTPAGTVIYPGGDTRDVTRTGVTFTTLVTSQATGGVAGGSVSSLVRQVDRLNLAKIHRLGESGVESDEWNEAKETLHQLADCYTVCDDY